MAATRRVFKPQQHSLRVLNALVSRRVSDPLAPLVLPRCLQFAPLVDHLTSNKWIVWQSHPVLPTHRDVEQPLLPVSPPNPRSESLPQLSLLPLLALRIQPCPLFAICTLTSLLLRNTIRPLIHRDTHPPYRMRLSNSRLSRLAAAVLILPRFNCPRTFFQSQKSQILTRKSQRPRRRDERGKL